MGDVLLSCDICYSSFFQVQRENSKLKLKVLFH